MCTIAPLLKRRPGSSFRRTVQVRIGRASTSHGPLHGPITGRRSSPGPDEPLTSDALLRDAWAHSIPQGVPFWIDDSFREAVKNSATMTQTAAYLPPDLSRRIFDGQADIEQL